MPVAKRATKTEADIPDGLRPYVHHGIDFTIQNNHGVADCPICGEDNGKFSVDCDSGLWRCWVCGGGTDSGGGNALTFLRLLHKRAVEKTTDELFLKAVAEDRRLCSYASVAAWGVCQSPLGNAWLVPGYGADGALDQLYRRTRVQSNSGEWEWRLLPTPGVWPEGKVHALHLCSRDYDPHRPSIAVCEGPWDGMALWEVLKKELGECNVVAVPGCNVWRDEWTRLCHGKQVTILFDSDHPRKQGIRTFKPGYDGVVRIARRLSGNAASVSYLRWGKDGWHTDKPDGWDVRDALSGKPGPPLPLRDRSLVLDGLLKQVEHASADWFSAAAPHAGNGSTNSESIETKPCHSYEDCEAIWKEAMHWREDMSTCLKVIFAVCASTQQSGDQVFLDIIGSPGVAKSTILRGALTSRHCVHVENISKLISGYMHPDDRGIDCSFLARSNNKTWITCEFDTILSSPQYADLMAKMRRIFDGETSATYGNSNTDRIYSSLRTPWIRAGTWKMMEHDQSQLGDRFLRVAISDPSKDEKYKILLSAGMAQRSAMLEQTNGMATSIVDSKKRRAFAFTGGYVDWLRANVSDKLPEIDATITENTMLDYARLADLTAQLRARPNEDKRKKEDTDAHAEFPSRLMSQYQRLATHLAVVLNKNELDVDVFRVVRKVAMDTSYGHTRKIANWMCSPSQRIPNRTNQECGGISELILQEWCGMPEERMTNYLMFLRKIGVVEIRKPSQSGPTWLLTDDMYELYLKVMGTIS